MTVVKRALARGLRLCSDENERRMLGELLPDQQGGSERQLTSVAAIGNSGQAP